jgi:hypothetical protein
VGNGVVFGSVGAGSAELVVCCGRGSCCVAPFRCRAMQCGAVSPQVPFGTPPRSMTGATHYQSHWLTGSHIEVLCWFSDCSQSHSMHSTTDQCWHIPSRSSRVGGLHGRGSRLLCRRTTCGTHLYSWAVRRMCCSWWLRRLDVAVRAGSRTANQMGRALLYGATQDFLLILLLFLDINMYKNKRTCTRCIVFSVLTRDPIEVALRP